MPDLAVARSAPLDLNALYPATIADLRRALRRLGVAAADVEDVAQEVYVTAHRRGVAFEGPRAARSWLYAAARRQAANHRRAQQRRRRREASGWAQEPPPGPETLADAQQIVAQWDRAVRGLTPQQREVFRLAALEGLSGPTIAERLAIPLNTAYSHLRRARSRVQGLPWVLLLLALLAVATLASTCAHEAGDDRARVALRGQPVAAG